MVILKEQTFEYLNSGYVTIIKRSEEMYNELERKKNITRVVEQLDISPTLYKNAVEKYTSLANFIKDKGIEATIYPQGSFALGTVVRPSKNNESADYDLDFICEIVGTKSDVSALEIYNQVKDALESDKTYKDRLEVWSECLTIKYADIGEVGFSIDVVPATGESKEQIEKLRAVCDSEIADTAIAIPKCNDDKYDWMTNNPLGYRKWFEDIHRPYKEASRMEYRKALFESCTDYASIEEIPDEMERSPLQRVIQILKMHRNNYFADEQKSKMKPKSVIITTLVTEIASHLDSDLDTFELLRQILQEVNIYANRQSVNEAAFQERFGVHTAITRPDGEWMMPNPANPDDNLVDGWNDDGRLAQFFFRWISVVREEILDSLQKKDLEFRAIMENAFGQNNIQKVWKNLYNEKEAVPVEKTTAAKPWFQS